ncbi:MAG: hypothetical protein JO328_17495 [Hyphomicrobiales bacterium]|nr:hypothetical protein [Hyphomicrobiales bacterium]MBV9426505.1 hypothetical protein [Bradyrhizobiaceae bacterium]
MNALAKTVGWIMPDPAEEYLDLFDEVHALSTRISQASERLSEVASRLLQDEDNALIAAQEGVPSQADLIKMINDYKTAKAKLPMYWSRIAERLRNAMDAKRPENAGRPGRLIPDEPDTWDPGPIPRR